MTGNLMAEGGSLITATAGPDTEPGTEPISAPMHGETSSEAGQTGSLHSRSSALNGNTETSEQGSAEAHAQYSLGLEELIASDPSFNGLEIDKTLEEDFRKTARSLGLKQEDAGSLAQMYVRHQARLNAEHRTRQATALHEAEAAWLHELKADPKFPLQLNRARAAVQSYGSDELVEVLESTRLGSHPAFVRFMARVGEALAEPAFARGENSPAPQSPAEVLYPNQSKL